MKVNWSAVILDNVDDNKQGEGETGYDILITFEKSLVLSKTYDTYFLILQHNDIVK
jgi:hypothetical protein